MYIRLQWEFLTLLAKDLWTLFVLFRTNFGKNFGHFAELEGVTNRIVPTKVSDKVRKLGRFL